MQHIILSANRTNVELKFRMSRTFGKNVVSANRTNVELKYS